MDRWIEEKLMDGWKTVFSSVTIGAIVMVPRSFHLFIRQSFGSEPAASFVFRTQLP